MNAGPNRADSCPSSIPRPSAVAHYSGYAQAGAMPLEIIEKVCGAEAVILPGEEDFPKRHARANGNHKYRHLSPAS